MMQGECKWEPIASVPKDGSEVLVVDPDVGMYPDKWVRLEGGEERSTDRFGRTVTTSWEAWEGLERSNPDGDQLSPLFWLSGIPPVPTTVPPSERIRSLTTPRLPALTTAQRHVFVYLANHIKTHRAPPSIREAMVALGFRSTNSVVSYLTALQNKGYIEVEEKPHKHRHAGHRGIKVLATPAGWPLRSGA